MPLTPTRALLVCLALGGCGPTPPVTNAPTPNGTPAGTSPSGADTGETWAAPGAPSPSGEGQGPDRTQEAEASSPSAAGAAAPTPTAGRGIAPRFQRILDQHNRHRATHCAPAMAWSDELAAVAQAWADKLKANGCAFEHSGNRRYGENLSYFMPEGTMTPEDVATGWYDEVSAYDFRAGRFGFNTGHFTQLVWAASTRLGCGVSVCNGGELWVCNYDPPGNVQGAFGRNVKPTSCK